MPVCVCGCKRERCVFLVVAPLSSLISGCQTSSFVFAHTTSSFSEPHYIKAAKTFFPVASRCIMKPGKRWFGCNNVLSQKAEFCSCQKQPNKVWLTFQLCPSAEACRNADNCASSRTTAAFSHFSCSELNFSQSWLNLIIPICQLHVSWFKQHVTAS